MGRCALSPRISLSGLTKLAHSGYPGNAAVGYDPSSESTSTGSPSLGARVGTLADKAFSSPAPLLLRELSRESERPVG